MQSLIQNRFRHFRLIYRNNLWTLLSTSIRNNKIGKIFSLTIIFFGLLTYVKTDLAFAKDVEITIEKTASRKIRLTLLPFVSSAPHSGIEQEINNTAHFDLTHAGYFQIWPQEPLPADAVRRSEQYDSLDYDYWLDYGTEIVVKGMYAVNADSVTIELWSFDMATRELLLSQGISGSRAEVRTLVHSLTGMLIERFSSGRPAITLSKIAFVRQTGNTKNIFVMDYDGYNQRPVTSNASINIDPTWTPDGSGVVYMSYAEDYPFVYYENVYNQTMRVLSKRPGLNAFPAVSPDGKKIALTLSLNGNPEIYVLDFNGGIMNRVTFDPAVDTSPTWAPDNTRLAFVSDRSGTPQIYVVNSRGGTPKRITYQGSYNTSPDWSPTPGSEIIVYSSLYGKNAELCIVDTSTGFQRRLTTTLESEDQPTWAPDGIHISYTLTQNYRSDIYFMDVRDEIPFRITSDINDSSSPDWGPSVHIQK